MQSSTVVTFRALVMLGCLVAIPLVALCGRSLPELVDSLWAAEPVSRQSATEAPIGEADFRPFTATDTQSTTVVSKTPPQYANQPQNLQSQTPQTLVAAEQSQVTRYEETRSAVVPAAYTGQAYGSRAQNGLQTESSGVSPPAQIPEPDNCTRVQKRLQQLGAVYYVLEFWGGERQLHRFFCRMAVGGDPNYTVDFHDTHADPLKAMTGVLAQVENWHRCRSRDRL